MKLPLIIFAVCAGLAVAGVAQAGEFNINQRFSGVGNPTMVDLNGDGRFANSSIFNLVGSPGRGTILSFVDFSPLTPSGNYPDTGGPCTVAPVPRRGFLLMPLQAPAQMPCVAL